MDPERKQPRALSPYAIAAIASSLVLLVSLALAIYFIELRGKGLRAVMATDQAPELLVLFGIVGVVTIIGYLMVASAVRTSSPRTYRLLLRRALEDGLENAAIDDELDDVPELRELLAMAASERARAQDVTQQLNALRRDMSDLHLGMEHSTRQLEPMTADQASDLTQQMARLWNKLLAQALNAVQRPTYAASSEVAPPVAPSAPPAAPVPPGMDRRASAAPPEVATSAAPPSVERRQPSGMPIDPGEEEEPGAPTSPQPPERIAHLGSELARLWGILSTDPEAQPELAGSGSDLDAAPLKPEDIYVSEPAAPEAPWGTVEDPSQAAEPETADDAWGVVEPHGPVAQWNAPPAQTPVQQDWMTAPEPPAPAAPVAPPSGKERRASRPGQAPPVPAEADADPEFAKLRFPRFVGKPVGRIEGRVEVTYEADDENTSRLPDEALLFEAEEESGPAPVDPIVDLRSLGAVEFDD